MTKAVNVTLSHIAEITGGRLVGDGSRVISGICSPSEPTTDKLCIVWEKSMLHLVPEGVPMLTEIGALDGRDGVEMKHPKVALPIVLPIFDERLPASPGIHPSASISESAEMGANLAIGPSCVISDGARIGDGVVLQAGVYIGRNVTVGEGTIIEAGVSIHDSTEVGRNVTLHSGVVIGCDGFGFIPMPDGHWEKIPQIGRVVIEDDVEIGVNCSIDRATFGTTRVGRGTKLGALVHIAHNCEIGDNCVMVGFIALGGSSSVGDGTIVAGMSGVADHVHIGSRVTVGGRSGVTKDIKDGTTISGFPARDHREENRFQASLRRVVDHSERIKALERELELLKMKIGVDG